MIFSLKGDLLPTPSFIAFITWFNGLIIVRDWLFVNMLFIITDPNANETLFFFVPLKAFPGIPAYAGYLFQFYPPGHWQRITE